MIRNVSTYILVYLCDVDLDLDGNLVCRVVMMVISDDADDDSFLTYDL